MRNGVPCVGVLPRSIAVVALAAAAGSVAGQAITCGDPVINNGAGQSSGPDVIVGDLPSVAHYGPVGDVHAYAVGTTSCNIGDTTLQWIDEPGPNENRHPVIAQNLYRMDVNQGQFEMLGMTWLKHGFLALQGTLCCDCPGNPPSGDALFPGCSDPYGAGLNGTQGGMGPRSEVNANSGFYPEPHGNLAATNALSGRITASEAQLTVANALYFVEGIYVAPDDAEAGNDYNNTSYRRVTVNGSFDLSTTGSTVRGDPAIFAWQRHGLGLNNPDPDVTIVTVDDAQDGRYFIGSKAINLGGGNYRYEYAIFNLNSDLSGGSFTVPFPAGASITTAEFVDVDYDGEPYANTDWSINIDTVNNEVVFSSPQTFAQNANSNALRWGTMYNFRFNANVAPVIGTAELGMFKSAANLTVGVPVPSGATTSNDDCSSPLVIGNGVFPFDSSSATTDGVADPTNCEFSSSSQIEQDLWYVYTAQCDGDVTVSTCGSTFDTKVAIYEASSCPAADSAVFCNDDNAAVCGAGSLQSEVTFPTVNGDQYLIRVGGFPGANQAGAGTMTVTGPSCGPDPTGACCAGMSCTVETAADCAGLGGVYQGDDVVCSDGAVPIGPNAGQTSTQTFTVSGGPSSITDINISLELTHSWLGDVDIELTHENSGTTVKIFDNLCGNTDNLTATFSDGAGAFNCGNTTGGATYAPDEPLSAFNGLNANSDWTITMLDTEDQDGGALSAASIEVNNSSTFNAFESPCDTPPAPPANDDCFNPEGMPSSGSSPTISTLAATLDGPASEGCGTAGPDVWYGLASHPSDGQVTFTSTASYNTIISVYAAGSCGNLAGGFIGCADGATGVTVDVQEFDSYLIRVAGANGESGTLTVNSSFVAAANGGCCLGDFTCSVESEPDCATAGGSFLGDGSDCSACVAPSNGEIELRLVVSDGEGLAASDTGPVTITDAAAGVDLYLQARILNDADAAGLTTFDGFFVDDDNNSAFGPVLLTNTEAIGAPVPGDDFQNRTGMFPSYRGTIGPNNADLGNGQLIGGQYRILPLSIVGTGNGEGIGGNFANAYKVNWSSTDPTPRDVTITVDAVFGGYQATTGLQQPVPVSADTFTITIGNPCPCEFGGDPGVVDVQDLLQFLSFWFVEDPQADLNGGGVDVTDLLQFLSCWFPASDSGTCP